MPVNSKTHKLLGVYVTNEIHDKFVKLATKNQRDKSKQLTHLIIKAIEEDERTPK